MTLLKSMWMFFCFDLRVKGQPLYWNTLDGVSNTCIIYECCGTFMPIATDVLFPVRQRNGLPHDVEDSCLASLMDMIIRRKILCRGMIPLQCEIDCCFEFPALSVKASMFMNPMVFMGFL